MQIRRIRKSDYSLSLFLAFITLADFLDQISRVFHIVLLCTTHLITGDKCHSRVAPNGRSGISAIQYTTFMSQTALSLPRSPAISSGHPVTLHCHLHPHPQPGFVQYYLQTYAVPLVHQLKRGCRRRLHHL